MSTSSLLHGATCQPPATCSPGRTAVGWSALISDLSTAAAFLSTLSMVIIMMTMLLLLMIYMLSVVMNLHTEKVGIPNSVFVCYDFRNSSGMARTSRHGLNHWQGSRTTTPKTRLGYPTSHGYPTSQPGGWPTARVSHTAAGLPAVAAAVLLHRLHA